MGTRESARSLEAVDSYLDLAISGASRRDSDTMSKLLHRNDVDPAALREAMRIGLGIILSRRSWCSSLTFRTGIPSPLRRPGRRKDSGESRRGDQQHHAIRARKRPAGRASRPDVSASLVEISHRIAWESCRPPSTWPPSSAMRVFVDSEVAAWMVAYRRVTDGQVVSDAAVLPGIRPRPAISMHGCPPSCRSP
jgi:hypothetical protein